MNIFRFFPLLLILISCKGEVVPSQSFDNFMGIPVSSAGVFVDERDGERYSTEEYCGKTWMTTNMKAEGGYCYTGDCNSDYGVRSFGNLYDLPTARQICPEGWHLPSFDEWKDLLICLGFPAPPETLDWDYSSEQHAKLINGFLYENWCKDRIGCGESAFNILPAGTLYLDRYGSYSRFSGRDIIDGNTSFWTSSVTANTTPVISVNLSKISSISVPINRVNFEDDVSNFALSCRCVKDD